MAKGYLLVARVTGGSFSRLLRFTGGMSACMPSTPKACPHRVFLLFGPESVFGKLKSLHGMLGRGKDGGLFIAMAGDTQDADFGSDELFRHFLPDTPDF